jgi:hypothetical protein
MALPPTIPTSFVPHSTGGSAQRFRSDLTGVFGYFAYGILGIALLLAVGVFFYGQILKSEQTTKDAAVAEAEKAIDPATVVGFLRLRDRLDRGLDLLKNHVAFSGLFTTLETLLPTNVRFSSLHVALDSANVATIEGSGIAKSFNALAAVSTIFGTDKRIKDAIFSKISINKDNTVSFGLTAKLDPSLIVFTPNAAVPSSVLPGSPEVPAPPFLPTTSTSTSATTTTVVASTTRAAASTTQAL